MAERSTTAKVDAVDAEDLEPVDIAARDPSVVLSVRLDSGTARQLHAMARLRGSRISDVLRDAAVEFARMGSTDTGVSLEMAGADLRVVIGRRAINTDIVRAPQSASVIPWLPGARTAASR